MSDSPPTSSSETDGKSDSQKAAARRRERSITAWLVGAVLLFALYTISRTPTVSEPPKDGGITGPQLTAEMVPLVSGKEPLQVMFIKAGCPVCHTIPGIEGAQGREGPALRLGTTGPQRITDPTYKGKAQTVREYIVESIVNPGVYIVPGYPTHAMPRWYGQKLSAEALDQMAAYLEQLTESPTAPP